MTSASDIPLPNISRATAVTNSVTSKTRPNILRKQPQTSQTPLESIDPSSTSNIRRKSPSKGSPQSVAQLGSDIEYLGTSPAGKNTTAREPAIAIATLVTSETMLPGGKSTSPFSVQTGPMSGQNSASTSQASSRNIPSVTTSSTTGTTVRPTLATLSASSENERDRHTALIGTLREYVDATVTNLVRNSANSSNQKANRTAKSTSITQPRTENLPSRPAENVGDHANLSKRGGATKKADDSFLAWQQEIHGVVRDIVPSRPTEMFGDHVNLSKSGSAAKTADDSFLAWQQEIHGVVRDIVHNNPVSTTSQPSVSVTASSQQPVMSTSATTATIRSMSQSSNHVSVAAASSQQPVVTSPSIITVTRNVTQTATTSSASASATTATRSPMSQGATPGPSCAEQVKRGNSAVIYNPILR